MTPENLTEHTGHMAWCALVALQLARRDGLAGSDAADTLFLVRWLSTALKQRRFPRSVTPDLEWLRTQGRRHGVRAKLASKLDYLWRSCTGDLREQSDLFRLTYGLETARDMGWHYQLLTEREWEGRHATAVNGDISSIFLLRTALETAFEDDGRQKLPMPARISGNIEGLMTLLDHCGWHAAAVPESTDLCLFSLTAKSGP